MAFAAGRITAERAAASTSLSIGGGGASSHIRRFLSASRAAIALKNVESPGSTTKAKKSLRTAIATVAARLGNTSAICRKSYVHPEVLNAFLDGSLARALTARPNNLLRDKLGEYAPEEAAVLAMLRSRPKRATTNGENGTERLRQQLAGSVKRLRSGRQREERRSHKNALDDLPRSRAAAFEAFNTRPDQLPRLSLAIVTD